MKNHTTKRIKELQNELKELSERQHADMVTEWYPKIRKQYLGKFFKIRNSYGSSDKGWWLYKAVTDIKETDIYDTRGNGITSYFRGWQFEVDSYKNVRVETITHGYVHGLEQEISEDEFNKAYNAMIDRVTAISQS